ncbi:MAG: class I tRNA ligase family protein, partial [Terriglobia bacterium]
MIKVYNTLSRKKEGFEPGRPNRVTIYVCGPTVYNFIHIGNARCYVAFDAIVRYLRYRGFDVFYARNLTDVDDKIINRASEENSTPAEIASQYTVAFENDMKLLGVGAPDVSPKATEHIDEMISMVEDLVGTGHAYDAGGDVFFDVASFDGY